MDGRSKAKDWQDYIGWAVGHRVYGRSPIARGHRRQIQLIIDQIERRIEDGNLISELVGKLELKRMRYGPRVWEPLFRPPTIDHWAEWYELMEREAIQQYLAK